jgi:hypothetical protein
MGLLSKLTRKLIQGPARGFCIYRRHVSEKTPFLISDPHMAYPIGSLWVAKARRYSFPTWLKTPKISYIDGLLDLTIQRCFLIFPIFRDGFPISFRGSV